MIRSVLYLGNKHGPVPRAYWMPNPPVEWTWIHNPNIPSWYVWIIPDYTINEEHGVWFAPPFTC